MNFIKWLISFIIGAFSDMVTIYINSKFGKTSDWQKLLGGVLPMVFNYLEAPIINGVENKLQGSDKFKKALEMSNKYLSRYVNVEVAQADLMAFLQKEFFKWKANLTKDTRVVFNGRPITIDEVI